MVEDFKNEKNNYLHGRCIDKNEYIVEKRQNILTNLEQKFSLLVLVMVFGETVHRQPVGPY